MLCSLVAASKYGKEVGHCSSRGWRPVFNSDDVFLRVEVWEFVWYGKALFSSMCPRSIMTGEE